MACTATLSVSNSSVNAEEPISCTLVVTNSGSSAVTVLSVAPFASNGSPSCSFGNAGPYPNQSASVAANGGTLTMQFGAVFHCGIPPNASSTIEFAATIGAIVYLSDTTTCVTSPNPTVQVTPLTTPPTLMPTPGQPRFDSNLNSYMLAVI